MSIRIWEGKSAGEPKPPQLSRRSFLRTGTAVAGGLAALAAALNPLKELKLEEEFSIDKFLQKHYKEMTPDDMKHALERIGREVEHRYKVRPDIKDFRPKAGVEFVYALNLSR
ncbi:MAG: twin-arginine translocation signal domain-containing protein, partial [Phycisphaerales bacterium]